MDRVETAKKEKEHLVISSLSESEVDYNMVDIYLRAFKEERTLEVWIRNKQDSIFQFWKEYEFCTFSGTLGPKRKEGDRQIPEGIYHIDRFNPKSKFHLSLGINYPNDSDKILADRQAPGSDIFIHGKCSSIGCIAITDEKIKELYLLAQQAQKNGQEYIRVDIYPFNFKHKKIKELLSEKPNYKRFFSFWKNLEDINKHFEKTKSLGNVSIDDGGLYHWIN